MTENKYFVHGIEGVDDMKFHEDKVTLYFYVDAQSLELTKDVLLKMLNHMNIVLSEELATREKADFCL